MSQLEFAQALGCSVSTVSKWERGESTPLPKQRRRLEAIGAEIGFCPSDWPAEERREPTLFDAQDPQEYPGQRLGGTEANS